MSRYRITDDNRRHAAEISMQGSTFTCIIDDQIICGTVLQAAQPLYVVRLDDGRIISCEITTRGSQTVIQWQGRQWSAAVSEIFGDMALENGDSDASTTEIRAPMPGRIVAVPAAAGSVVKRGDPVVVIEAMKMQNAIIAPRAGTVQIIHVHPGDAVEAGQLLVVIAS